MAIGFVGNIKGNYEIEAEYVDDMITTAFEGGVNYWCDSVKVVKETSFEEPNYDGFASQQLTRHNELLIHDMEEDIWLRLTLSNFMTGLQKAVDKRGTNLLEDFDAEDADVIVQLAVFGDIVYG